MKDKIIEFIEGSKEYPTTGDLIKKFCPFTFPIKRAELITKRLIYQNLLINLLELIDEVKIFYDSENQTWAVLPKWVD